MPRWIAVSLSFFVAVNLAGCGGGVERPPMGKVVGTVRLDGQPVTDAEVTFSPEKGRPSMGRTDASGKYTLTYVNPGDGALVGKHKVMLTTVFESVELPPDADPKTVKRPTEKFPAKVNSKTELTAEVKAGQNTIDFDVSSK